MLESSAIPSQTRMADAMEILTEGTGLVRGETALDCAYCERPLICDHCQADVIPADEDQYRALSAAEEAVDCPNCGRPLICHWCKTPYDGGQSEAEGGATAEPPG